jgi:Type IV secretion-system coupling protein DNA-binding domain
VDVEQRIDYYTHGLSGLVLAYAIVAACVIVGLVRARAPVKAILTAPIIGALALLVAAVVNAVLLWSLTHVVAFGAAPIASMLLSVLVFMVVGFAGGFYWARGGAPKGNLYARGAVVLEQAKHPLASPRLKSKGPSLRLAGVPVPVEDEVKHFKLIGATGTGKSTAMRELLHGALARGDRAVIADPDGGYLSRFYAPSRGDVILNPFDARSAKWDVFSELRTAYDVAQLARSLIPERGGDPQWPGFARTFFEAVTTQAHACGIIDLDELHRLLTTAPQAELRLLIAGTPAATFTEEANIKMFLGQRATASEYIKCLDYIRRQRGVGFSVKEWVRSGKGVLFLPYQADQIAAIRSVISTWMRLAIFQTMSLGEGDHRLWFAIDELDALGAIDGLFDALVRLRRFGGRCVLGFQSIGQVSTTFGQGPAEAIVENCSSSVILRCSASERGGTSRFASQLIGEREVVRTSQSRNRSHSWFSAATHDTRGESEHYATEPAVMASQIEQLPDRAGYLKFASHPAWMKMQFPIYDLPKIAEPFVPG